jgi:hypothetical protein
MFVFLVVFGLLVFNCHANIITVIENPFRGSTGDYLHRGFYVENFGADNLYQVVLLYSAYETGVFDTSLTVRIGTYDGTIVGETKYLSTFLEVGSHNQVVYDFGGIDVPVGSLLTFTQEFIDGPTDDIYYDIGLSSHSQITQTMSTSSPLDTFRRDGVGVTITAIPEPCSLVLLSLGGLMLRRKFRFFRPTQST